MSGGFFRGTSADQDTRFSNKQAKLLKSQKFPSVLDHLVDMTKVKMDVLRPWIAKRTTELLGFEDEVLINFVYGLLDAKEADGKKIQIQLTGFMEKNTGKFMKELWGLLLSAQNNVSGVPQQFLDEKEEETRKKKVETDRIAQEIQKRRDRDMDGRERERERKSRFDGEADNSRFTKIAFDPVSKFSKPRTPSVEPAVDREMDGSYGSRSKNGHTRSPPPNDHLPSPPRISPSPIRSSNKSVSRSSSYSGGRHKSKSLSVSSMSERQSVSPGLRSQSPVRRSVSPKRRNMSSHMRSISPRKHSPQDNRSPTRRRSPHLRRRSRSRSRHRSPPYFRYRSPRARRSPRRRSRSPVRRRSPPLRQRSPSPMRRRSPPPWRRRSPLPLRRRSPVKARRRSPSPVYQRSPVRRRSVSPVRHRTPPPLRGPSPLSSLEHQRRSPLHSPKKRTADSPISAHQRKRNYSPYTSQSPPRRSRRSLSRERDGHAIGESRRYRDVQSYERSAAKRSLVSHASERQMYEHAGSGQKISESMFHKVPTSLRSPQHDVDYETKGHNRVPVASPQSSPSQSQLPPDMPKVNQRKNRRSRSLSKSPVGQASVRVPLDSPMTNRAEKQMSYSREVSHHRTDSSHRSIHESPKNLGLKKPDTSDLNPESLSPDRRVSKQSPVTYGRQIHSESKKDGVKSDVRIPERNVQQLPYSSKEEEFGPGKAGEDRGPRCSAHDRKISAKLPIRDDSFIERHNEHTVESERANQLLDDEYTESPHGKAFSPRSKKKASKKGRLDRGGSDSEETDSYKNQNVEKRRQKKSDKRKRYYDESSGSDSQIEDKKDAKRRKKDEKRLRKEEKRRRREEKHHRKLERRAGKLKLKSVDTVTPPSDFEKHYGDAADSDSDAVRRKNFHPSDVDEMESEQKQLEIELREKALESLRAKKATTH